MKLHALIDGLGLTLAQGDGQAVVSDLTDDSRRATPGCAFIARTGAGPGGRDGRTFIEDALRREAAAVILPAGDLPSVPDHVAVVTAEPGALADQALASRLAERFFGEPSAKLKLIGVTGTNGKTTVAWIARHVLARAGVKAGLIGTIQTDTGEPTGPRTAELTTPGAIEFSRLLAEMVANGCDAAVAEVSSHALHQGRVAALQFDVGVFTNLTGDHLDYHGDMDAYAEAKATLFGLLPANGWAVINADDPYAVTMLRAGASRVVWTTLDQTLIAEAESRSDDSSAHRFAYGKTLALRADGCRGVLTGSWGSVDIALPLVGRHNIANALQAVAAVTCVVNARKTLRTALQDCPQVPGRLERVAPPSDAHGSQAPHPTVLVDYAHTDDALTNVLTALRPVTPGQLIALVGCGGDRDTTKRPRMARVACELADRVWITSDNPRTEDPQAIIDDMLAGVPEAARGRVTVVPDRAEAIADCVLRAGADDTVLLAGKGHEDYQIIAEPDAPGGTVKIHFDDREQAAAALARWARERIAESRLAI